jgi:hypothetical protein
MTNDFKQENSLNKPRWNDNPKQAKHPLTEEQNTAVNQFMSGENLKVTAFAGAGKTSTLAEMANVRNGRGLYLAFNRAIADEATNEFPKGVDCRTTHSVALRAIRDSYKYSKSKLFDKIGAKQLAKVLELGRISITDAMTLNDVQQAYLFLSTIRRFCQSGDREIAINHVNFCGQLLGLEEEDKLSIGSWVAKQSSEIWKRMHNASDEIPLGHDGCLKLWSLTNPTLDHEFILLDEAQDTNPAVMSVLENQQSQIVYVGDKHQQIYEWRGTKNAMASVKTPREAYLTQSFRFGDEIAVAATGVLRTLGEQKRLQGNPMIGSHVMSSGGSGTVLTRTNAMVISEVLDCLDRGQSPHIVGGTQETLGLVGDVFNLMDGKPANHPDFFGFTKWDQVVAFSKTDEGEDLVPFVGLVKKYGAKALWAALKKIEGSENDADLVISTTHKSKGRQWPSVRIASDFTSVQSKTGTIPREESRLFYVAITRAQEKLVVDNSLLAGFVGVSTNKIQ